MDTLFKIGMIVLGVILVMFLVYCIVIPFLIKRGVKVGKYIKAAKGFNILLSRLVAVVSRFAPQSRTHKTLQLIYSMSHVVVDNAEKMYLAYDIDKDGRKKFATNAIEGVLSMLDVDVDDDTRNDIDKAVEYAVGYLPKTHLKSD